jgi:hypothetical protein
MNKNVVNLGIIRKTRTMKTISVSISDLEFSKFGLKSNLSFSDLLDIVSRELSKQRLAESLKLAEKYGLSEMTMDEITKEVKAVRKNAKNRH